MDHLPWGLEASKCKKKIAQRRSTNEFYRKLLQRTFLRTVAVGKLGTFFFFCWTKKFHGSTTNVHFKPNQQPWRFQIFFPPKKVTGQFPKSNESDQMFRNQLPWSHSATVFLYDFGWSKRQQRTKWLWKFIWFSQKPNARSKAEITAGPYGVAGWQAEEEVLFRGGFPWG